MLFKDNRDIRDNRYEGDLIVECSDGVSKEEALCKIKQIIQNDADYNQHLIDGLLEIIKGHQITIDRCNSRLEDPSLQNIEVERNPLHTKEQLPAGAWLVDPKIIDEFGNLK